jgi:DNA-binding SARP family transcriptional activator/tetratricopeptide (TPR) repeat protein
MLRVRVLGPIRVELDGRAVEPPVSRRAWSLLAYLAIDPGPHRRGDVAARFWPDVLDSSARQSLRNAVWALRRALGPAERLVMTTREEIWLDGTDGVWVDAVELERLLAGGRPDEALALGGGDLLAGFDEPWVLEVRAAYRDRVSVALEALAVNAERDGDHETAVRLTRREIALDRLDEAAHRRLMTRLAAGGDRSGALSEYELLRERLRRELRVVPAALTRELADELRHPDVETTGTHQVPAALRPFTLVGRDHELGELGRAWSLASGGSGGVVLITGEPGIGKTRLAVELLARVSNRGARTASCAALDLAGAAPLGLWAELIRELVEQLEPPPPDAAWPSDLAVLAPEVQLRFGREPERRSTVSPDLERARLYQAIAELVSWGSHRTPVVLLIEDIHLADTPSLDLAGFIGRQAVRLPVLVIMTRRPLPASGVADRLAQALRGRGALLSELELGPLAQIALTQLVREVAPLGDEQVAGVVAAAEGNALLAIERARALARGRSEPPASLRAAVRGALAPLSPEPRLVAEFAAVAGRELTRTEIEALPVGSPAEAATGTLDSGLLVASAGKLGYRHALLREAVYADLPDPHRSWLHEHLAAALARQEDVPARAAEVARHLLLAGRAEGAARQLVRAATHARGVGALEHASAFLHEAIDLRGADPELLVELAEVEAWRQRAEASDEIFHRALNALPASGEQLARVWLRRGYWNRGALCRPHHVLESARRVVGALDDAGLEDAGLRAKALAMWAWAEAIAGDPDTADRLLEEAQRLVGRGRPGPELAQDIGHARALALVRRGRFRESYSAQTAAGEAAERIGRPDLACGCWLNAACVAACAGEFERALQFVERGSRSLRGHRLSWFEVQILAARAYVLARLGRLESAREAVEGESVAAERADNPELRATAEHDEGMIALALGDYGRAADLLGAALAHGAPVSRPLARLARAEALARLERCDEAEREIEATVLEPVGPGDFPDTLVPRMSRVQGLIAAARRETVLAARLLEEAAAGWRRVREGSSDGERYTGSFADLARPPVLGLVEPERELERVLSELASFERAPA